MGSPDTATTARKGVHWTVKTNYRLRAGSFAIMFASIVLHGWDKAYSPALWSLIALQLLVYPHLMYWRARRSPNSEQAEASNLVIDSLLFGLLVATLGFPLWITFTVYIASTLNITISRGTRGMLLSQLAFAGGVLVSITAFGWHLSPATDWPATLLCLLGNTVYMIAIGITAFARNRQLRKTREDLRLSEQTLTHRLSDIQDLQAKLQEQATRDPLTGLYNRRFLDTIVDREIARCHRDNQYMVVMMIDVDHFKHVNDTYGHPGGDEVLKALSALLLEKARATDVPCRYGGEEFLLLLPGMTADIAMVRANQWRAGFAEKVTLFGEASIQATMSIGVAVYPAHGETLQALTRCADLALYRAKADGRNQVVMYGPEMG
ncbi:MAG: diguanylate cyclase [Rhodoferax sp.]|nr:diguanylate cyclase [Rhodoferax sp.]